MYKSFFDHNGNVKQNQGRASWALGRLALSAGTYPGNHQGVISTTKYTILGKMTPSCILQDFLYLFESKEIF